MAKKNQPSHPNAGKEETEPALKHPAGASITEDYAFSLDRDRVLDSLYLAMADAFSAANALKPRAYELTPRIYEELLPEQVLILAAHLGLIAATKEASEARGVRVGCWFIDTEDRDHLLQRLASVIALVRATENVRADNETPDLDYFCKIVGWHDVHLIRALAHTPTQEAARHKFLQWLAEDPNRARSLDLSTEEAAWKKFLQRLSKEPRPYLERIDDRTYARLTVLRELMATLAPEEFGNFDLNDLAGGRRMPPAL